MQATSQLKGENTQLFIATIKPHVPMLSPTIAKWLKKVIKESDIDSRKLFIHSTFCQKYLHFCCI